MDYFFSKTLSNTNIESVKEKVTNALKEEGFGVLTEIDVQATMKKKLDLDYKPYLILGACNPEFANKAITAEPNIGTMLPCNVILRETDDNTIEVSAVDPVASMKAIENASLSAISTEVRTKLKKVIDSL